MVFLPAFWRRLFVVCLSVSGSLAASRPALAQIYKGEVTATATHRNWPVTDPSFICSTETTWTFPEATVSVGSDGSVTVQLRGTRRGRETGRCPAFDSTSAATFVQTFAAGAPISVGLLVQHTGGTPVTYTFTGSVAGGGFTGSVQSNASSGTSHERGYEYPALNAPVSLARRSCYEAFGDKTLSPQGGQTEIVTPSSCGCTVSSLPSWFSGGSPTTVSDKTRFIFSFTARPPSTRVGTVTLACGAEVSRVTYRQPAKPRFLIRTPSVGSGVRG
jgi:hypothetical protein